MIRHGNHGTIVHIAPASIEMCDVMTFGGRMEEDVVPCQLASAAASQIQLLQALRTVSVRWDGV